MSRLYEKGQKTIFWKHNKRKNHYLCLLSKGAKGPVDLCSARTEVEQTGLKVSSLYIAQIKKKCGLDVGENFNLPKSENAKQPQCTPEKKEAIMQAFRHFGII